MNLKDLYEAINVEMDHAHKNAGRGEEQGVATYNYLKWARNEVVKLILLSEGRHDDDVSKFLDEDSFISSAQDKKKIEDFADLLEQREEQGHSWNARQQMFITNTWMAALAQNMNSCQQEKENIKFSKGFNKVLKGFAADQQAMKEADTYPYRLLMQLENVIASHGEVISDAGMRGVLQNPNTHLIGQLQSRILDIMIGIGATEADQPRSEKSQATQFREIHAALCDTLAQVVGDSNIDSKLKATLEKNITQMEAMAPSLKSMLKADGVLNAFCDKLLTDFRKIGISKEDLKGTKLYDAIDDIVNHRGNVADQCMRLKTALSNTPYEVFDDTFWSRLKHRGEPRKRATQEAPTPEKADISLSQIMDKARAAIFSPAEKNPKKEYSKIVGAGLEEVKSIEKNIAQTMPPPVPK